MPDQMIYITNSDDTYVEMIREVLQDAGYRRIVVHVGPGTFHQIRDLQPALVLLDIGLTNPGQGWYLLDLLSLHPKTRAIPVIACSTDMRLLNEKAALMRDLGYTALEKPFDLETLLERVAAAIGPPAREGGGEA